MGIKMYQALQNTLQLQDLRYKVDQLFEAAGNYYNANCAAGSFSPTPPFFLSPLPTSSGTLTYPPTAPFPVGIAGTLQGVGFLQNWQPANPVVDASAGEAGYLVQLNPVVSTTPIPANACVVLAAGSACLPVTAANIATPSKAYSAASGTSIPLSQAVVVTWAVQVAVKVQPSSKIAAYAALAGADCMSDSSSAGTVDACTVGNPSHQYLVWSRIPSVAVSKNTIFSSSMQLLKQYKQMYVADPNYAMNSGYSTTSTPAQAPVYYLCGG